MRRSIKTKLIWTLSGLITGAVIIGGLLMIYQNATDMRREIFLDALTFAELTNDQIVTSFEQFYLTDNFLQFRKDVNPLLSENVDISKVEVVGKTGDLLYDSIQEKDLSYRSEEREHEYSIARTRDIKPSLLFADGRIVYAMKTADNEWVAVNDEEEILEFPTGEVVNVMVPHQNARTAVVYTLSYDALWNRVWRMALSILAVLAVAIFFTSLFAIYFANRLVKPIRTLEEGVVRISKGSFGAQVEVESDDEIGVLADTFNAMSKTLKKNTEELLEKEKLTKELEIARNIQQGMLPEKAPEIDGLDVAGSLQAATTIGGDIYDYLEQEGKDPYLFIADVTGHGVPAGMVATITHSTLYSYSQVFDATDEILKAMNRILHAKTQTNMFATALLARWDRQQRSLRYCNAGHEQIMHYQASSKQIALEGKGGMALGMIENLDQVLSEKEMNLATGDVLVFYTDGIPEAWKSKTENMGMERFQKIVQKAVQENGTAEEIRSAILAAVSRFMKGYQQQDDITLIVIKATS